MSPEHFLPVALGRFDGYEPLLDRLCRECNNTLGRELETQFARAGPTGLLRWMLGIRGRDGLPPSPFRHGAAGAPPILMLARPPDCPYDLLCEVEPGTDDAVALRQMVFVDPEAGAQAIPLTDSMREQPEQLLRRLRERGIAAPRPVYCIAAQGDIPWIEEMLRRLGIEAPISWICQEDPAQRVEVTATVRVTSVYFRAVAKIAFHYVLKMFPQLSGREPEFAPIKDFIWRGGDNNRFVVQRPDQFLQNFRHGERPRHWMHILAALRGAGQVSAFAQFFAGPQMLPPGYGVRLGADPSPIFRPVDRRMHYFVITDPVTAQGPVGRMEDGHPAQWIEVVPW